MKWWGDRIREFPGPRGRAAGVVVAVGGIIAFPNFRAFSQG
jgi:hypothetical protein